MPNWVHNTIITDTPLADIIRAVGETSGNDAEITEDTQLNFERIIPHPPVYKELENIFGKDDAFDGQIIETIVRMDEVLTGRKNPRITLIGRIASTNDFPVITITPRHNPARTQHIHVYNKCLSDATYRKHIVGIIEEFHAQTCVLSGHDMNTYRWGTKWNACDCIVGMKDRNPYYWAFDTAWERPTPVLLKLSQMFPDTTFTLISQDEDPAGYEHELVIKAGETISDTSTCMMYEDDEVEEEEDEA